MTTPARVWSYPMSGGTTGTLAAASEMRCREVHQITGLEPGAPLLNSESARSAGGIAQSIASQGGATVVERLA